MTIKSKRPSVVFLGKKNLEIFQTAAKNCPVNFENRTERWASIKDEYSESTVWIFDEDYYKEFPFKNLPFFQKDLKHFSYIYIIPDSDFEPPQLPDESVVFVFSPKKIWGAEQLIRHFIQLLKAKTHFRNIEKSLDKQRIELVELNKIGTALSAEHDGDALLELILQKAREITTADAGSLYLIENKPGTEHGDENEENPWVDKQLRFKLAQNDTVNTSYKEFVMPIERKSMAGYTVHKNGPVTIADAYKIPKNSDFKHNSSFDEMMGYRTKSVLCLPLRTHQGEILGVLQLINRKRKWETKLSSKEVTEAEVIPFDQHCMDLTASLASQITVSLENQKLYAGIKKLFEGFIYASVQAIEQRDPTTSGHSSRVATLTVGLAKSLSRIDTGIYKDAKFSSDQIQELRYASLLHDFGKIGVRESVLVKAKKLFPGQLDLIKLRMDYLKKAIESNLSRQALDRVMKASRDEIAEIYENYDRDLVNKINEVDKNLSFIVQANEPRILAGGDSNRIKEIGDIEFEVGEEKSTLLTCSEVQLLSIKKGSLSDEERKEIESHVTHTYNFLKVIPWSKELKHVPEIAFAHHEKIDGTGYPRNLKEEQIMVQSKMMAISDIYDALTASDRPYKKALPFDKALDILDDEVKLGKLDPDLYKVFVDSKTYELTKHH